MAKMKWLLYVLALACFSTVSEAFVRNRRSAKEQEPAQVENHEQVKLETLEAEKPLDNVETPNQVRTQRWVSNNFPSRQYNSLEFNAFANPQYSSSGNPQQYLSNNNGFENQQLFTDIFSVFGQPQSYNKFPVYGPPKLQPNNFVPGPAINNHYLASPVPWFPQPFYCYYPIVITIPPYNPPTNPDLPTDDNMNTGDEMPNSIGNRIGEPDVDPSAYNNTLTGISLDVIKPVREPSVTAPPVDRLDGVPQQNPNQIPTTTLRPRRPTPRPPQPRPTQRPQNSFRPPAQDNSIIPNYPVFYPEDSVSQSFPNQEDDGPSACVRAIVGCCLPNRSRRIPRERCFEINGCPGAFFDSDPCDSRLAIEALRTINLFNRRG